MNMRQFRDSFNGTQSDISKLMGVNIRTVARWETAAEMPRQAAAFVAVWLALPAAERAKRLADVRAGSGVSGMDWALSKAANAAYEAIGGMDEDELRAAAAELEKALSPYWKAEIGD